MFDEVTGTVDVTVGNGESAVISRLTDSIALDGVACDTATVTNTDLVTITGTGQPTQVTIDLSGGAFAPGLTLEPDGAGSEIEFVVTFPAGSPTLRVQGSAGDDAIVLGSAGINLNASEALDDVDVTISGSATLVAAGGDGNDLLSVAGGAGTGSAISGATLRGEAGSDLLLGAVGGDTFDGGPGSDTVDYSAAVQLVLADLENGSVEHAGGAVDVLSAVENLTGSPGNDVIVGSSGPNILRGEGGDDTIDGGDGDDTLNGGDGIDTVEFRSSSSGVTVDLRDGTATGAGSDALAAFENIVGSDNADTIHGDDAANVIRGRAGADRIFGHDGADLIRGGTGNDELFGQAGDDLLLGGRGRDRHDGGDGEDTCRGGPDPDSYVRCENFPPRGK